MAVLPTTLTEPSSNEERWSKWLEVGFGAAAAIAAVYVCIAKILDRRRKMKGIAPFPLLVVDLSMT